MSSQVQGHGSPFVGFGGGINMMPQSQVEPGRFGGRPDKKKKKGKSRVSGF
jgi:RNA polymerase I-specific transcription initiation factor RRN6